MAGGRYEPLPVLHFEKPMDRPAGRCGAGGRQTVNIEFRRGTRPNVGSPREE